FTEENLREKIVVEDGYDGVITNYEIIDNSDYENNYATVGRYTKTIKASDTEGNTQTLTIILIVTDTTSPQIFYDKFFIVLTEGESLTDEMIKAYASQALGVDVASILTLEGNYNTNVVGKYEIGLYMMDGSVKPFTISVGDLIEKEPARWTFKGFFSNNMDNWTKFDEWPAWSICAWLSWAGIALGVAIVAGVGIAAFVVHKKKKK
ncbi:MAG: hypothetical protein K2H06_04290, partial [Anaeroplasmataceae bacterium]|nr:hypothetical protein [Anaeroplasmataceae bacterium]